MFVSFWFVLFDVLFYYVLFCFVLFSQLFRVMFDGFRLGPGPLFPRGPRPVQTIKRILGEETRAYSDAGPFWALSGPFSIWQYSLSSRC